MLQARLDDTHPPQEIQHLKSWISLHTRVLIDQKTTAILYQTLTPTQLKLLKKRIRTSIKHDRQQ